MNATHRSGRKEETMSATPESLSITEVAHNLNCSDDTVRRMISRGELRAYRVGSSRLIRIKRADLERAMRPVTRLDLATVGGGR
jgi:excisionase family DNA binding protein